MKLIADSGSSKTDWILLTHNKVVKTIESIGLNPYYTSIEQISQVLTEKIIPFVEEKKRSEVYFYGAGCTLEMKKNIETSFKNAFTKVENLKIVVESDLLGAARSVCGNSQGVVCILGTGANACLFDGQKITQNSISLGWALGDEGSGNFLGKRVLLDWIHNKMPFEIAQRFENDFEIQIQTIKHKIYNEAFPAKYLASFAPFLARNKENPYCKKILETAFDAFFEYYILPYSNYRNKKMYFVGSIAFHFSSILKDIAKSRGFSIQKINQKPILGLVDYHRVK